MELDFIPNINEFGDNYVRLYNFDKTEAAKLKLLIEEVVIKDKQQLDLSLVSFIEPRNCNLILAPYKADEGIITGDNKLFYCALTLASYQAMLELITPFCNKDTKAHQFLYELDNPNDFLFSPAGTW